MAQELKESALDAEMDRIFLAHLAEHGPIEMHIAYFDAADHDFPPLKTVIYESLSPEERNPIY